MKSGHLKKKSVIVESNDIVLPGYTNMYGTLFGGKLMEMIDKVAAICATRYCHELVVTASVEAVDFHVPIKAGYYVTLLAKIIHTGTSSMMIRVHVWGEEPLSGNREHCCTAFVNMVAIDSNGSTVQVPAFKPETEEEKKDLEQAVEIRKNTLLRQEKIRKTHNTR